MPRYNVEHNGKYACFSGIVEAYITPFMSEKDYDQWRLVEYGRLDWKPIKTAKVNRMSLEESFFNMTLIRTKKEVIELLKENGMNNIIDYYESWLKTPDGKEAIRELE